MKKIILLIALTLGALQANTTLVFDTTDTHKPQMTNLITLTKVFV